MSTWSDTALSSRVRRFEEEDVSGMSQVIGTLKEKVSKGRAYLGGEIATFGYQGPVSIVPAAKRSDRSPDFTVYLANDQGVVFVGGSAWLQRFSTGGSDYLSLSLQAPGLFDRPLRVAAFRKDEGDEATTGIKGEGVEWNIVWSPQGVGRKPAGPAVAVDDEIPF